MSLTPVKNINLVVNIVNILDSKFWIIFNKKYLSNPMYLWPWLFALYRTGM